MPITGLTSDNDD